MKPSTNEPIWDAVGRLALLCYHLEASKGTDRRREILREMHERSERLTAELRPLCECCEDHAAQASTEAGAG